MPQKLSTHRRLIPNGSPGSLKRLSVSAQPLFWHQTFQASTLPAKLVTSQRLKAIARNFQQRLAASAGALDDTLAKHDQPASGVFTAQPYG